MPMILEIMQSDYLKRSAEVVEGIIAEKAQSARAL